jgi:hypothetical protein
MMISPRDSISKQGVIVSTGKGKKKEAKKEMAIEI